MSRKFRPYGKFTPSGYKPKEKFEPQEAPICKFFGCDKKLTPQEYLYSEYCFKHAREIKKPQIFDL